MPKPSNESAAKNVEEQHESRVCGCPPKPDDSGKPEGTMLTAAAAIAERAGHEIADNFRTLGLRQRRSIVTQFRRQLIPPRKAVRRRTKEITAAYADWKAGLRGLALYQKHIRRFGRMTHWERKAKTRALMDAIHARKRREQRKQTPVEGLS